MTTVAGILGAAFLFALFAFTATRRGTRLEEGEGCHGGGSCSPGDEACEGCGGEKSANGWWPDDGMTYGGQR